MAVLIAPDGLDCLDPRRVYLQRSRFQRFEIFGVCVRDPLREVRREQDRGLEFLKRPTCGFAHVRDFAHAWTLSGLSEPWIV